MKVKVFAIFACAALALNAAELAINSLEDFKNKHQDLAMAGDAIQLKSTEAKKVRVFSKRRMDIEAGKTYELAFSYRGLAGTDATQNGRLLVGLEEIAKDKRFINAYTCNVLKNTMSELLEAAPAGSTQFLVKDASKWKAKNRIAIQLNAKEDNSDLPNFAFKYVKSVEPKENGWLVSIDGKTGTSYPAGTKVRASVDGSTYTYLFYKAVTTDQWTAVNVKFSAQENKKGVVSCRPGTVSVGLVLLSVDKNAAWEIKDISIKELEE